MEKSELSAEFNKLSYASFEKDFFSWVCTLDEERESIYAQLKGLVFDREIRKADLYFSYGAETIDFESALIDLQGNSEPAGSLKSQNRDNSILDQYAFNEGDVNFYLQCKDCFGDFQVLLVEIERSLWNAVFSILQHYHGENWVLKIDVNKRENWARTRESFRTSFYEHPLHEFSTLPDLRELVTSNWVNFSEHLPTSLSDRPKFKRNFNEFVIPTRNKIFHPTRAQSLTFSEYNSLVEHAFLLNLKNWRNIEGVRLDTSHSTLPPPVVY